MTGGTDGGDRRVVTSAYSALYDWTVDVTVCALVVLVLVNAIHDTAVAAVRATFDAALTRIVEAVGAQHMDPDEAQEPILEMAFEDER